VPEDYNEHTESEGFELCFCMGKKDRKDKKIFEGDYLISWNDNPEYDIWDASDQGLYIVEFDLLNGFRVRNENDYIVDIFDEHSVANIKFLEVIGNKFEDNIEDLKKEYNIE
jgi:hypothetical protein